MLLQGTAEPKQWSTNFEGETYHTPGFGLIPKLLHPPTKLEWLLCIESVLDMLTSKASKSPFLVEQYKGNIQHAIFGEIWGKLLSDPIYPVFCKPTNCLPTY